ncbi:MAG TPA: EVE domain-containing protein [Opitutaceae bacterium]|nr:EVE domain-containing protein [Opitutaceae bacterium]
MQYWLVKTEPEAYSWETFTKEKRTSWDGVRSYPARLNLRAMKTGDHVLFYASVTTKAVQGIAKVSREHYPDPTDDSEKKEWVSVELTCVSSLPRSVSLDTIKATPALKNMALLRQSRLSVMPLTAAEYKTLVKLGEG